MQTLRVFVCDMLPGDRFLSNRRSWVTVISDPAVGRFGYETTVRTDDGDLHNFAAPGIYRIYRPGHRRDCGTDWIPTAYCTGEGFECRDIYCPRHRAAAYADQQARHATDSVRGARPWW